MNPQYETRATDGDSAPTTYNWRSPCCGALTVVQDWMVAYANANTASVIRIQCGRYMTDPLRAAGTVPSRGCAQVHAVPVNDLRNGADG